MSARATNRCSGPHRRRRTRCVRCRPACASARTAGGSCPDTRRPGCGDSGGCTSHEPRSTTSAPSPRRAAGRRSRAHSISPAPADRPRRCARCAPSSDRPSRDTPAADRACGSLPTKSAPARARRELLVVDAQPLHRRFDHALLIRLVVDDEVFAITLAADLQALDVAAQRAHAERVERRDRAAWSPSANRRANRRGWPSPTPPCS